MIDAMTLAEAGEIFRYWEAHPPPHLLLAAVFGAKPKIASSLTSELDVASLPPGIAVVHHGNLGMPAPVLDLEEMRGRNRRRALAIAQRNAGGEHTTALSNGRESA